jgi:riboflavin synthase
MFTGLIEEVGHVLEVARSEAGGRFTLSARKVLEGLHLGDSVAVDGACMTVVAFDETSFSFEASPESLARTQFEDLAPGSAVNLERPLQPGARLGGHFVMGHVDGLARLLDVIAEGNSWVFRFQLAEPELAVYLIEKGSIAVNGISLTVNTIDADVFSVAIIPHTWDHTNLSTLQPDDRVNIEVDMLGKYVVRYLQATGGHIAGLSAAVQSI